MYDELIKNFASKLIEKDTGMGFMLKENKKDDLKMMHEIFNLVPECIDIMASRF